LEYESAMTPAEANIAYPALVFTQNSEIYCAPGLRNLTRWYEKAIENIASIIGMDLVGSDGKRFTIQDVQVIAEVNTLPSGRVRRFLAQRFRKRLAEYHVSLTLAPASSLTFEQIKAHVRDCIVEIPERYLFNYSPENDLPENDEYIAEADDVDSLPAVLAEIAAMKEFDEIYYQFHGDTLDTYDGPLNIENYR
jgi:hypothetical protein